MPEYRVFLTTTASASITVDVPEGVTDPEEIAGIALEEGGPSLCAKCAGWRQSHGLELGEWDVDVHEEGPLKGIAYVTEENGNVITGK